MTLRKRTAMSGVLGIDAVKQTVLTVITRLFFLAQPLNLTK